MTLFQTPKQKRTLEYLKQLKRDFAKQQKRKDLPSNIELLQTYRDLVKKNILSPDTHLEQLLRKRSIRSESGIVSVQVLTKPYACPGQCIFCPQEENMPKSYLKSEPGAMRAYLNQFDPIKQVYNRLLSLTLTWHPTDKIEMIVLGGTFDVYPKSYKVRFIKRLYDACNTFHQYLNHVHITTTTKYAYATIKTLPHIKYASTIFHAQKINEHAHQRIIGLTIETRPEYVTDENCIFWRMLGVTRIEMGIQSLDDKVLQANKRGHTVQQARQACDLLRRYGFKISLHIMPGLYTSTYEKDIKTFKDMYADPYFKPDEIKLYPTSVLPNTELYQKYLQWVYQPLTIEDIKHIVHVTLSTIIPPYTRIKRLIRDIPSQEIVAWSNRTNLAQLLHKEWYAKYTNDVAARVWLYKRIYGEYKVYPTWEAFLATLPFWPQQQESLKYGDAIHTSIIGQDPDIASLRTFISIDTRSREIRNNPSYKSWWSSQYPNIVVRKYQSSGGDEYLISFEDRQWYLYGFVRLLLPYDRIYYNSRVGIRPNTALIRELHIYGKLQSLQKSSHHTKDILSIQHTGQGKQLMIMAEAIAKIHGYTYISVIAWIGVRGYYRQLWYKKHVTYMTKRLS